MSTVGGSVTEAARGLAARLRAVGPAGRRRSAEGSAAEPTGPEAELATIDSVAAPAVSGAAESESAHQVGNGQQRRRAWMTSVRDATSLPDLLVRFTAWSLCLLVVAAVAYLAFKVATALRLLVIPLIAALLISALLQPLTARFKRRMPPLIATWLTVLLTAIVFAGVVTLITARVQADYPSLAAETQSTVRQVEAFLAGPPFRLSKIHLAQLSSRLLQYLGQHKTLVIGTVLTGGRYFIEGLTGIILTLFITFFLLKDGRRIWSWLISGLGEEARARANRAGDAAWQVLVSYIRGSTIVAAIHASAIGVALWLLGVPLVAPLMILVFLAAYVPLVGILVVGALAIMVTLATKGVVAALILLIVFLAENQFESHLLQPLVVGRVVRLHPLAIVVVLAVGGIVAGVPGAIVAVPTAAVATYSWPYLRGATGAGSK